MVIVMKKLCFIILFTLLFVFLFSCSSYAISNIPSTSELDAEQTERCLQSLDLRTSNKQISNREIIFFDANEKFIAIGHHKKIIDDQYVMCLYDSNFNYLRTYEFQEQGTCGIILCDDYFMLWIARSSIAVIITYDGIIQSCTKIDDIEENKTLRDIVFQPSERLVGDKIYNCTGLFGIKGTSNYCKLTLTDTNGNEQVLYEAFEIAIFKFVALVITFFVIFPLVIVNIVKKTKKHSVIADVDATECVADESSSS